METDNWFEKYTEHELKNEGVRISFRFITVKKVLVTFSIRAYPIRIYHGVYLHGFTNLLLSVSHIYSVRHSKLSF